jgi:hypothetical protein
LLHAGGACFNRIRVTVVDEVANKEMTMKAVFARMIVAGVLCLMSVLGAGQPAAAEPDAATIYIVDNNSSGAVGTCISLVAIDCSLRDAIALANVNANPDGSSISFNGNYLITLAAFPASARFQISGSKIRIVASPAQDVRINANGNEQAFRILGNTIRIEGLRIYNAGVGTSNIWISNNAYDVSLTRNIIGAPTADSGLCPANNSYSGIFIDATGTVPAGKNRATIWNNIIRCHAGTAPLIAGPGGQGIDILTDRVVVGRNDAGVADATTGNVIDFNSTVGVNLFGATNTEVVGNIITDNGTEGVRLANGANNNTIGGPFPNTISNNGNNGMLLASNSSTNTITSNFIGVTAAGIGSYGNGSAGVSVLGGRNNKILLNVIAGNGGSGVSLSAGATSNLIAGNRIGVDKVLDPMPNLGDGIRLSGATNNRIGSAPDIQHISNNGNIGIILLAGSNGNTVAWENRIERNVKDGILINASDFNEVHPNVIANNGRGGVWIQGGSMNAVGRESLPGPATNSCIYSNAGNGIYLDGTTSPQVFRTVCVGVQADGVTPAGNGGAGIFLENGTTNAMVRPGRVMHNTGAGVALAGSTTLNNLVNPFEAHSNGGLAIDLGNDGFTPNDAGDADAGPNDLLNYPVVTGFNGTTLTGTACANCPVGLLEKVGDPTKPGGGFKTFVVSGVANAAGAWSIALPAGYGPHNITAQTCRSITNCVPSGTTSELSPAWAGVMLPITIR